jgi:hypothetical protein
VSDASLDDLVRAGFVTPPLRASGVPPRTPAAPTGELLAELAADREER